jgi:nitroreductase/dihydropteridine reductase
MDIISVALKRHSTKAFDASKKLTAEEAEKSKPAAVQPVQHQLPAVALYCRQHRGRKSARGEIRGGHLCVQRTQNAGCLTWWCSARKPRWTTPGWSASIRKPMVAIPGRKRQTIRAVPTFADMHRVDLKDDDQWMAKQVYLNVGNFLLGGCAGPGRGTD